MLGGEPQKGKAKAFEEEGALLQRGKATAFEEGESLLQKGKSLASVGKARSLGRDYLISQAPPAQETAPSSSALVYCLPEKSTLFQSTGL